MSFEAIYMPANDNNNPSKGGFDTANEAWDYIKSLRCKYCKAEVEAVGEEKAVTPCDAEWLVEEEK